MNKNALDAIETASIDELRSVQFERMQKTLRHAYQNSPYQKSLMKQAYIPTILNNWKI